MNKTLWGILKISIKVNLALVFASMYDIMNIKLQLYLLSTNYVRNFWVGEVEFIHQGIFVDADISVFLYHSIHKFIYKKENSIEGKKFNPLLWRCSYHKKSNTY